MSIRLQQPSSSQSNSDVLSHPPQPFCVLLRTMSELGTIESSIPVQMNQTTSNYTMHSFRQHTTIYPKFFKAIMKLVARKSSEKIFNSVVEILMFGLLHDMVILNYTHNIRFVFFSISSTHADSFDIHEPGSKTNLIPTRAIQ